MEHLTLYKHQQEIIDENPQRYGLFHDMGTGKTITLLALAQRNNVISLIVCPKALKAQWLDYVRDWSAPHKVMTKEEFKKYEALKQIPPYEAIIIDECHHFSNITSSLYKQMKRYLAKNNPTYRWIASGTPYRSSAMNIFALATLLGYDWNYYGFHKQFFDMVRMGPKLIPKQKTGPKIEAELASLVNTIGGTLRLDELVDVPTQTNLTEYFELTQQQKDAIKELQEPMAITRFTKTHCIENGLLYSDGYSKQQTFPSLKTDRLLELVAEHPKIAIVCRYTAQLDYYQTLFKDTFRIDGSVPNRAEVVTAANDSKTGVIIIQAQCSEGYELPSIPVCVFASLSFSHVDHVQMKARFLRINKLKENTYYYLVTKGVDKAVYDCIMEKRDFHEQLFIKNSKDASPLP